MCRRRDELVGRRHPHDRCGPTECALLGKVDGPVLKDGLGRLLFTHTPMVARATDTYGEFSLFESAQLAGPRPQGCRHLVPKRALLVGEQVGWADGACPERGTRRRLNGNPTPHLLSRPALTIRCSRRPSRGAEQRQRSAPVQPSQRCTSAVGSSGSPSL